MIWSEADNDLLRNLKQAPEETLKMVASINGELTAMLGAADLAHAKRVQCGKRLNRMVQVLGKSGVEGAREQVKAVVEWAIAYGTYDANWKEKVNDPAYESLRRGAAAKLVLAAANKCFPGIETEVRDSKKGAKDITTRGRVAPPGWPVAMALKKNGNVLAKI